MNKYTSSFEFNGQTYYFYDLKKVFEQYPVLRKLPNSLKLLLESNIRNVKQNELNTIIDIFVRRNNLKHINFYPNRVIMNDFTGIPVMVDLATMRDSVKKQGLDAAKVNPQVMVDLIIDEPFYSNDFNKEVTLDKQIKRNNERFQFAKWASNEFENFSVIPPGLGTYPQVNLEYLSTMISAKNSDGRIYIFPESIVGTDSHAVMTNALGILGWNVNAIEVQSSILGSSVLLDFPKVVGVEVVGSFAQGVSASDAVLSLTNILKEQKTTGKIIEFYGAGLRNISIEDRATLSNMAREYGVTCAYFSVDDNTISFVEQTRGVDASLIKEYYTKQGLYNNTNLEYDEYVKLDLSVIRPIIAGPKRPQDKLAVEHLPSKLDSFKNGNFVKDNDVVLASITSCPTTSNPTLLIQAGLLAKKAVELGLNINSNISRTISPDSLIVKQYLKELDLLQYFEKLGFEIIDFDSNTCLTNTSELVERVSIDIDKFNLNVSSVSSGNESFEKRIHPQVKSNWLMSPSLVIAYCLKGNMNFDITKEPISSDIYLSDIWPSIVEVNEYLEKIDNTVFSEVYKNVFVGNQAWQDLKYEKSDTYNWDEESTYIQASSFCNETNVESININEAKIVALLGDDINSEHLSPKGQIPPYSPAALYLQSKGLRPDEFNTFANRRSNKNIMSRSILSNIRLRNKMVLPKEGGYTKDFSTGEVLSIFDFSQKMKEQNRPLVIIAGENFGIGNSREWASKGLKLLGIEVVIAKSFEKKYKSDLVSMGILPLEFIDDDIESLSLKGDELICINNANILADSKINVEIKKADELRTITLQSRLDTNLEVQYFKSGGAFSYLLNKII